SAPAGRVLAYQPVAKVLQARHEPRFRPRQAGRNGRNQTFATGCYEWRQVSGPEATLAESTAPIARLTAPTVEAETTLVIALTVNDGQSSASDTVQVRVTTGTGDTSKPVITAAPIEGPAPLQVTFTADTLS